jgi:hypothetical protein
VTPETKNDRLLNRIIIYGFSFAFGALVASLQALRPAPAGFVIELSFWSLIAFVVGAALTLPCFQIIVYSRRQYRRRLALAAVVFLGLGAFFYPIRVVPQERVRAVFVGLAAAAVALSVVGGLLLSLHRFFEKEEKRSPP